MFIHIANVYGQITCDGVHDMYYYDIYIKIKNCHPFSLQGVSQDVVSFNKKSKTLQQFVDCLYSQADYCVEPSVGVYYLPDELVGNISKQEWILRYGQLFEETCPSRKFKLKDGTVYVDKYMIKGKKFVTDQLHLNSSIPKWLMSSYNKTMYLLYDVEQITQLPIDKKELIFNGGK